MPRTDTDRRQKQFGFALPESQKPSAIIELLQRGETVTHIAAVVDWSKSRVHRHAQRLAEDARHRPRQWINEKIEKQVEQRLDRGEDCELISREMCLSISSVRNIRRRWLDRGMDFKSKRTGKRRCETCGSFVIVWPCVACAAKHSGGRKV
jgi:transposase